MARDLTLGPSDAPCPVEPSTVHGVTFFRVMNFYLSKSENLGLVLPIPISRDNQTTEKSPFPATSNNTPILDPSSRSRRSVPSTNTRKRKLGFNLVGLFSNFGPTLMTWPITKTCGPTSQFVKPRCVYVHQRSSLIFLIAQHTVWDGRRLQPCRVATSYVSFVLIGLFEDLSLSKNFGNTQSPIRFNPSRTFSEWYRQLSNWSTKASPEGSNHRISLTAGLYLGPLLASFPVRVSRMHGNFFFWMEISFIENFYRSCSPTFLPSLFSLMTVSVIENLSKFGSYNLLPRWFSLMICLLIDRSLCSYLESTSLNWLWEYLYQTLISNSSTTQPYPCRLSRTSLLHDLKGPWQPSALTKRTSALPSSYMERILPRSFIASLWPVPASHEAKYPSLTSQNHMLKVTIPKIPELFAEVSSTHHDLVCGMLLDSLCFGVSMILSSKFDCLLKLSYVCFKSLFQNYVLFISPFWD